MKRTFTTAITTVALLGMFGSKVLAQDAPNPNEVTIRNITYGGTGCPSNTVAASVSPDAKAFTLFFDQFVAQGGPGTTARDSYKVCNLSIDLRFPAGWTYSLVGVDYRGFAQLDPGVTGQQRSEYWIQGVSGRSIPLRSDIFGPYANDYRYSDLRRVGTLRCHPRTECQGFGCRRGRQQPPQWSHDCGLHRRRSEACLRHSMASLPVRPSLHHT